MKKALFFIVFIGLIVFAAYKFYSFVEVPATEKVEVPLSGTVEPQLADSYFAKHSHWTDTLKMDKPGYYCRQAFRDCAKVFKEGNFIVVDWDNWGTEVFLCQGTNCTIDNSEAAKAAAQKVSSDK